MGELVGLAMTGTPLDDIVGRLAIGGTDGGLVEMDVPIGLVVGSNVGGVIIVELVGGCMGVVNPPLLEFGLLDLQFPVPQYTPNDADATKETN
jgi:hypothetical protein